MLRYIFQQVNKLEKSKIISSCKGNHVQALYFLSTVSFTWQTYVVLFAFLEDVVLSHTHCLHDHFNSVQLDVAILSQVALW